jgi:bacterioferritin
MRELDRDKVLETLNRVLEQELAGVVRYTHYSFMVFGHSRIPIVSWLNKQAQEALVHAQEAGEMITHLGGYPSLSIGPLLDSHKHDLNDIMRESLQEEHATLKMYMSLLDLVTGRSILLEEYARKMIAAEEMHAGEVDKMLRRPGDVAAFSSPRGAQPANKARPAQR